MTFTYMQAHIWQSIERESWNGPNTPVHHRCEGRYSRLHHPLGQRKSHMETNKVRGPQELSPSCWFWHQCLKWCSLQRLPSYPIVYSYLFGFAGLLFSFSPVPSYAASRAPSLPALQGWASVPQDSLSAESPFAAVLGRGLAALVPQVLLGLRSVQG